MCGPSRNRLRPPREKSGFSLLEALVSLGIFSLVLILAIGSLRISPSRGQARGLAVDLKSLFAQTRAKAVVSGSAVAIVFPTGGGATPVATDCVVLEGTELGKVRRRLSYSGNYPGVGIFIGQWTTPPSLPFTPPRVPTEGESPRFQVATWLPPEFQDDAAYIFLPSGEVVSNGLKVIKDEFPLVVASRMQAAGGAGAGTLSAAEDAVTVLLSRSSTVRLENGVVGASVASGGSTYESWPVGSLSSVVSVDSVPEVLSVEVLPAPIDQAYAASVGAECIVELGGVVTLRVKAKDDDGGPLTCEWTGPGHFSHTGRIPMLYSPEEDLWVAEWHWTAPTNAVVNDIFSLNATVRDQQSQATIGAGIVTQPQILVVDKGVLAFCSQRNVSSADPNQHAHAFAVRYDGTNLRALRQSPTSGFWGGLAPSRDGRRIAIGGDYGGAIRLMSTDGVESTSIGTGDGYYLPCFSPDGTKVYASSKTGYSPLIWSHFVLSFDASGASQVDPSPFPGFLAGWSPDGTQALVQKDDGSIVVCDISGVEVTTVYTPGSDGIALDWNAAGIFYATGSFDVGAWVPEPGDITVFKVQADGSGTTQVFPGTVKACADIGGNGRYLFHVASDGIRQIDLASGNSRIICPAFIKISGAGGFSYGSGGGLGNGMWRAIRFLTASI